MIKNMNDILEMLESLESDNEIVYHYIDNFGNWATRKIQKDDDTYKIFDRGQNWEDQDWAYGYKRKLLKAMLWEDRKFINRTDYPVRGCN